MSASLPFTGRVAVILCTAVALLAGCASLAVRPCDTIEDRDGKYVGRFFLGVATLGLSEVAIQSEEVRQASEGWRYCPPPPGIQVVNAQQPSGANAGAVANLVNGTRWALSVYLNQDPGTPGRGPFTILRPGEGRKVALIAGRHRLEARPTGGPPGTLPAVTWSRQIEIDPRVRSFKLQFNEVDFKWVITWLTGGSRLNIG